MFEKALVYRAGVKSKVDIGLLAETRSFIGVRISFSTGRLSSRW
jgi:hypothetical protein